MGRTPCCDKKGLKKGPWTPEEDDILVDYIQKNGHGSWRSLPKLAGLMRCGKSCRLRWTNYLRPDIKRGPFTQEEEKLVIQLHGILGNRWAAVAAQFSGRTDNEIKNLWNTHLKKRLLAIGLDPQTHQPLSSATMSPASPATRHMAQWESARLEAEARLSKESLIFNPQNLVNNTPNSYDHFLRIWNSEVGKQFRNFKKDDNKSICASPVSQDASSSTKCGSVSASASASASAVTTEISHVLANEIEDKVDTKGKNYKSLVGEMMLVKYYNSSCDELEDSSDSPLQMLLDFPINNDMSFLEVHIANF